ncbi:MAG: pyridoxal-phosphate dependent enzyme [Candidatus Thermoplasmatota archaeon]|jgi:threonine synthase|nr:pyridoxal-phosphate dependent enzyme [Candidatus Thermoplasmatota archaeon]
MQERYRVLGNTPLIRAEKLGKFLNIEGLYIKYEGSNPTGTQKDRAASVHILAAISAGYDTIVVGSCGNYGASIAYYAHLNHLKSRIYIPKEFHSQRLEEIEKNYGATLVLVEGKYEDSVEASKRDAIANSWFDGNAGAHPELGLEAYSKISSEIHDSIGEAPVTVSVPVGNGTTLAGIYYGFANQRKRGEIKKVPRMIAASTEGGNPVVESFKKGLKEITDFPVEKIRETEINEALVNYHSYDGDLAYKALLESEGYAEYVTDEDLISYKDIVREYEGIDPLPPAVASLAATVRVVGKDRISGIHVAILTG